MIQEIGWRILVDSNNPVDKNVLTSDVPNKTPKQSRWGKEKSFPH